MKFSQIVLIKGAGDLASGIGHKLFQSGFPVVMTDLQHPTAIRRTVSFSSAILEKQYTIENVVAEHALHFEQVQQIIQQNKIAVITDPLCQILQQLRPHIFIEATISKKNTGIHLTDAPIVLGIGPGYTAPQDCHAVVETKRGHHLGRVYYQGSALPNTGIPGNIEGFTKERLLLSPCQGIFKTERNIADKVQQGDVIATVQNQPLVAPISGVIRGLLAHGTPVEKNMKSGDIDPRNEVSYCFTVSDKARAIAGGVLEAILHLL
ncbi:MAG TPA: selenium-dependent molybdenum cofactor biosynthesis protein YqeB [Planctomycetota bacterium]|nr:selenium-dependent molybdenum cofactor biosynthesis protein YqeB [Planctomycetota bacterium]HRU51384.1 selenium-dependent molybdenum cofactor biosynthesis protein YqeB [Planctomycetota bacterium]